MADFGSRVCGNQERSATLLHRIPMPKFRLLVRYALEKPKFRLETNEPIVPIYQQGELRIDREIKGCVKASYEVLGETRRQSDPPGFTHKLDKALAGSCWPN